MIRKKYIDNYFFLISMLFNGSICAEIVGPYLISADELPITLSTNGQIYALSGDVTGDITITADDVTLNLNERVVTGNIIISGQRAIVYGGKVIAPAPVDNTEADAGIVQVHGAAARLLDLYISAEASENIGVRGATGVFIDVVPDVIIRNCLVRAGSINAISGGAQGGIGVLGLGDRLIIENTQIYGGNGSFSGQPNVAPGYGGTGCSIQFGVQVNIANATIVGGDAGSGSGADLIDGGNGGHGLELPFDATALITDVYCAGGRGSDIFGSTVATVGRVYMGNGGDGVNSDALELTIYNSILRGGQAGSVGVSFAIGSSGSVGLHMGKGGNGLAVTNGSVDTCIDSCELYGGASGTVQVTATGNAGINNVFPSDGRGGHGIIASQQLNGRLPQLIVKNCTITGGLGDDITSASPVASLAPVYGNNGGSAVAIEDAITRAVSIIDCDLVTLKGGDVIGASGGLTHVGGDGGIAVNLTGPSSSQIVISNVNILQTGRGGDVTAGTNAVGGNGGTGIVIGASITSAAVSNTTISYTGRAGTGSSGTPSGGAAIVNNSPSGAVFYSNMAFAIEGTPVYNLGIATYVEFPVTTGTAFAAAANPYANVHQ